MLEIYLFKELHEIQRNNKIKLFDKVLSKEEELIS